MQEIVPLILSGGDPASVETLHNWDRVPWLEETRAPILNLGDRPSPRMFTTHFLYNMMPASFYDVKPKVHLPHTLYQGSFKFIFLESLTVQPCSLHSQPTVGV